MDSNCILSSKRLYFRKFMEKDLKDLFEYFSEPDLGESAGWAHHETIEQTRKVLNKFIEDNDRCAIIHKNEKKLIGHISYKVNMDKDGKKGRELGYAINKKYWNQGLMTETLAFFSEYLFENDENLDYIFAECRYNSASERALIKANYTLLKENSFFSVTLNEIISTRIFSLSKNDFKYLLKIE